MGWPNPFPRLASDNPLTVACANLRASLAANQDDLGDLLGYCAGAVSGIETGCHRGPKCLPKLLVMIDYERRWQQVGGPYLSAAQFYNRLTAGVDDIDPAQLRKIRRLLGMCSPHTRG